MPRVGDDSSIWKWAIISIDNALQGYMTTALIKGNSFDTWREKDRRQPMTQTDIVLAQIYAYTFVLPDMRP